MVVSRLGYAGISRNNSHQLNIAGAVDATLLSHASPLEIIESIFAAVNFTPPAGLATATLRGTPPLTSHPRTVASERVFLIGDAAGYVEPFTGEGMAAALESAVAVTPLVAKATRAWSPQLATAWQTVHRDAVRNRQRTCEMLAWILRRPWVTFATLGTCRAWPAVATHWITKTTAPPVRNRKQSTTTL
jgi:flavin-dependent dehydrogenase